jgi:hypothetical protein
LSTTRFKRLVERLVDPSRVHLRVALVTHVEDEVKHNVMLRRVASITLHERNMLGVGVEALLQGSPPTLCVIRRLEILRITLLFAILKGFVLFS